MHKILESKKAISLTVGMLHSLCCASLGCGEKGDSIVVTAV
jgi:hypothetical protein